MYYYAEEKASGKPVDFDFNPVGDTAKAVFHSKEDLFYFMDVASREKFGADKIDAQREKFAVKETA
ncbi:MAG: hypothetical protein IJU95_01250 [Treponema sp.]|nr:hypothetical protein [Treponema sp.]